METKGQRSLNLWGMEHDSGTNESGGTWEASTSVRIGTRTGTIVIEIDEKGLLDLLGPKALRNKNRKATLAGGVIVAYATDTTDTKED